MATAKAGDKTQVCRKLVGSLQKLYGKSVPRLDLPTLETILFGICLEDNPWSDAEAGYNKLLQSYFDLNEIRVSSVAELETTLQPLFGADWKGLRIRSLLRFIFESTYSFEFEKLRRLTLEAAVRQLKKIPDQSSFVRDFCLQYILGSHVIAMDDSMMTAARWLGLIPADLDSAGASDFLKGGVRKSDINEFSFLLRSLATDPKYRQRFLDDMEESVGLQHVADRLTELQSPPKKKPARKPSETTSKASTPPKSPDKKTAQKAAPAKPRKTAPSAETTKAGKPASRKTASKPAASKTTKTAASRKPARKK
ncbi:MAG: hypothetical protein KDA96_19365 [Planctomycetaceae bacterium]|nr:hypothetical protein [Planctomycetaceae bacterium]